MSESEKRIEQYLISQAAKAGFTCEKFISPGKIGVPDRILTSHPGIALFVEVKSTGEKPTPPQARDHKRRKAQGFVVEVVDSYTRVDLVIAMACALRQSFYDFMEAAHANLVNENSAQ